jgi:hypothetical protein
VNRKRVEMEFGIVLVVCHHLFLICLSRNNLFRIVTLLPRPATLTVLER